MSIARDANTLKCERPKKTPYKAPSLKIYGTVAAMTRASGSVNGDAGQGMMVSERRLKENIVEVGRHPRGFGLYLFDYKPEFVALGSAGRQFGVMVDEVECIVPGAISRGQDGVKMVDYAMLGISRQFV